MLNKCDNLSAYVANVTTYVLNKCENACPDLFKEALVIKKIKYKWNEKMKALQKKGFSRKVILNTKKEMAKLKDFITFEKLSISRSI